MTKKLFALLLAAAMVLSLAACSSEEPATTTAPAESGAAATTEAAKPDETKEATETTAAPEQPDGVEQVMHINYMADPKTWDPCDDVTTTSANLYLNTYISLYRTTENGDEPSGASSYEISEDGTVYTFHLNPDAKFQDGTPIKASDWEFTWKRLLDPKVACDYAWYLADFIKGGYDLNGLSADDYADEAAFDKAIEEAKANVGVKALDDTTLEVTLTAGCPYFVSVSTHPCLGVMSQAFVEGLGDATYGTSPETTLCSGPFYLASWDDDQQITLKKNENYINADAVKLDEVHVSLISASSTEILMYENNELDMTNIDMSTADAASYADSDEYSIWGSLGTGWIDFQCKRYPLDNPLVREALCTAINYEELCESVIGGGVIAPGKFIPDAMPNPADPSKGWREGEPDLQLKTADPDKAKELLTQAGWTQGADGKWTDAEGKEFPTIEVNYRMGNEADGNIATAICGYWATIGIPGVPDPMESALRSEIRPAGDFWVTFAGWGADYADASNFLVCLTSTHYYNYGQWYNEEYDKYMNIAATSFDQAVRYEAMCKAEDIIFQEYPVIMFQYSAKGYLQKPYVQGTFRSSLGMLDLEHAFLTEH